MCPNPGWLVSLYKDELGHRHTWKKDHGRTQGEGHQLQTGTRRLPLQGLSQELLQLLTFNTPWKEFWAEIRNEALCALGKTGRTGHQIVRSSWEIL